MGNTLEIAAPAKINLTLDVLNRRSDGYHNIESLIQTVQLEDTVQLQPSRKGIKLEANTSSVPPGEDNLAWQAASLVLSEFSLKGGIKIWLEKRIPVQAGLAGGSSDAAAVIRGMAELYDLQLNSPEIFNLAARLGSDVPFFLFGGTKIVSGRGEHIWELPDLPPQKICLIVFPFGLSTAEIYRTWEGQATLHRTRKALASVFSGSWEKVKCEVGNDLEVCAKKKSPVIGEVLEKLRGEELGPVHLSGSGPTVIVYGHPLDSLGEKLESFPVKIVPTVTRGRILSKDDE